MFWCIRFLKINKLFNIICINWKRCFTGYPFPSFKYAESYGDKIAIEDKNDVHSYKEMFVKSCSLSYGINNLFSQQNIENVSQQRIGILCDNNVEFVLSLWAVWMLGHTAVPLSYLHPCNLLVYYLRKTDATAILFSDNFSRMVSMLLKDISIHPLNIENMLNQKAVNNIEKKKFEKHDTFYLDKKKDSLILFTSGSTGMPKGVTLTFLNVQAQVNALLEAWSWSSEDIILHCLPLHHTHGLINALLCPLTIGARCIMIPKFDSAIVWDKFLSGDNAPTLFMGVPTMYAKLIEYYKKCLSPSENQKMHIRKVCQEKIRLMISGSAPLPEIFFNSWFNITGHHLLERYGMTETGMILSNRLYGKRYAGYVGTPLPHIHVRIVQWNNKEENYKLLVEGNMYTNTIIQTDCKENLEGELIVKGPSVFAKYWNEPDLTNKEFIQGKWFRTGDKVLYKNNNYKILGRLSVDIIKSGGFKLSAIEIEKWLLSNSEIKDACVIGISDITWGQKVVAVIEPMNESIDTVVLKKWLEQHLPSYAIPKLFKIVCNIPRNIMGKVNKKELIHQLFPNQ